jgi:hypothetical protein
VVLWKYAAGKYVLPYIDYLYIYTNTYILIHTHLQGVRPYSQIPDRDLNKQDRAARKRASAVIGYLEGRVTAAEPRILPAGVSLIRRLPAPINDRVFAVVYGALLGMLYSAEVNTVRRVNCPFRQYTTN